MNPGEPAAGFGEAIHQLAGNRVAADRKDDGDVGRGGFRLGDDRSRQRVDETDVVFFEGLGGLLRGRGIAFDVFDHEDDLFAFLQAEFFEPIAHPVERLVLRAAWEKNADAVRLGRLGGGAIDERERPNNAKEKCLGNHKFLTAFRQGCIGKPSN